jgi:hypothetical protein
MGQGLKKQMEQNPELKRWSCVMEKVGEMRVDYRDSSGDL